MLSKTDDFNLSIIVIANFILHNRIRYSLAKSALKIKLKNVAKNAKLSTEEIEYAYLYLLKQGILFIEDDYININFIMLEKILKRDIRVKKSLTDLFIIQNNFEIIVKPETDIKIMLDLIQICEFKNRDVVFRFSLTSNSIHNAFLLGWNNDKVIRFLSQYTQNSLPQNVIFLINETFKRTGEIVIGKAGLYITGDKFIMQQIKADEILKEHILKEISAKLFLMDDKFSAMDIFQNLKSKDFFPEIKSGKIDRKGDDILLRLTEQDINYIYSAIIALKEIGYEYNISVDYNIISNLLQNIESKFSRQKISESQAIEIAVKYKQELKNHINKEILKRVEADLNINGTIIKNEKALQYQGKNPALNIKEMKNLIEFAIQKRLYIVLRIYTNLKKREFNDYIIDPKYFYRNRVYGYVKDLKEEKSFDLKRCKFILLPEG